MAKLSHLEKEYIKANHKNKTAEELSKKLEKDKEIGKRKEETGKKASLEG